MPFRSVKQRNFLRWKKPAVYRKFVKHSGTRIVRKKKGKR